MVMVKVVVVGSTADNMYRHTNKHTYIPSDVITAASSRQTGSLVCVGALPGPRMYIRVYIYIYILCIICVVLYVIFLTLSLYVYIHIYIYIYVYSEYIYICIYIYI